MRCEFLEHVAQILSLFLLSLAEIMFVPGIPGWKKGGQRVGLRWVGSRKWGSVIPNQKLAASGSGLRLSGPLLLLQPFHREGDQASIPNPASYDCTAHFLIIWVTGKRHLSTTFFFFFICNVIYTFQHKCVLSFPLCRSLFLVTVF